MKVELNSFPLEELGYLERAARLRGLTTVGLVRRLIHVIAKDQMVLAVLDDEGAYNPPTPKSEPELRPRLTTRVISQPARQHRRARFSHKREERYEYIRRLARQHGCFRASDLDAKFFYDVKTMVASGELSRCQEGRNIWYHFNPLYGLTNSPPPFVGSADAGATA